MDDDFISDQFMLTQYIWVNYTILSSDLRYSYKRPFKFRPANDLFPWNLEKFASSSCYAFVENELVNA